MKIQFLNVVRVCVCVCVSVLQNPPPSVSLCLSLSLPPSPSCTRGAVIAGGESESNSVLETVALGATCRVVAKKLAFYAVWPRRPKVWSEKGK